MINACVIGLGQRGYSLLRNVLLKNTDINIVAVCDLYDDRIEQALNAVADAGQIAKGFTDYKEALATDGVDAVFVFSDWSTHTEIAIYAIKNLKLKYVIVNKSDSMISHKYFDEKDEEYEKQSAKLSEGECPPRHQSLSGGILYHPCTAACAEYADPLA